MEKHEIDVLNSLTNEQLLDLYNQVNDHISYLNENIITEEKEDKKESTDNNG